MKYNHLKSVFMNKLSIVGIALGMLALGTTVHAEDAKTMDKEKCYGISKAGKNDCSAGKTSCAGSAKTDNDPEAFIVMPKGMCDKIAGGVKK